ncbi:unnamed protein product, partial [Staurois parvus]
MGPRTAWSRCCWVHSVTWVAVWPPIAAASTATLWLQTLVFGPVTGQMSEV